MTATDLKQLLAEAAGGPWDVAIEPGCHAIVASVLPEGANIIAVIFNKPETPEREPLRFANARLIALAPELAQEVLALRAERDRLREALKPFACIADKYTDDTPDDHDCEEVVPLMIDLRRARAALGEKNDE